MLVDDTNIALLMKGSDMLTVFGHELVLLLGRPLIKIYLEGVYIITRQIFVSLSLVFY